MVDLQTKETASPVLAFTRTAASFADGEEPLEESAASLRGFERSSKLHCCVKTHSMAQKYLELGL